MQDTERDLSSNPCPYTAELMFFGARNNEDIVSQFGSLTEIGCWEFADVSFQSCHGRSFCDYFNARTVQKSRKKVVRLFIGKK